VTRPKFLLPVILGLAMTGAALAQTQFPFGGLKGDPTLPVEVSSDSLAVSQTDGSATFSGNVVIGQGEMRLSADMVVVEYAAGDNGTGGRISRLHATGKVTLVNGTEAAEADEALYTIDTGIVVMTGNVILTQGKNAISGEKLTVDLKNGTGTMDGRVRTVLQPGGN
jgi:lipopolysaccharide export system protein LptA